MASLQVLRQQLNGETIALLHAEGLLTEAERDNAAAQEIGYAPATRQRGCSATLELGKERMPYAYTIAPSKGDEGGYTITGAEPAMVEARYGRIGPDGNFGNKAEPVGRDNVERAFRAGVEALHSRGASARQRLADMRRRRCFSVSPANAATPALASLQRTLDSMVAMGYLIRDTTMN